MWDTSLGHRVPRGGCGLGWLGRWPACHAILQTRSRCAAGRRAHPDVRGWVSQLDWSSRSGCAGQPDTAPCRHRWFFT